MRKTGFRPKKVRSRFEYKREDFSAEQETKEQQTLTVILPLALQNKILPKPDNIISGTIGLDIVLLIHLISVCRVGKDFCEIVHAIVLHQGLD